MLLVSPIILGRGTQLLFRGLFMLAHSSLFPRIVLVFFVVLIGVVMNPAECEAQSDSGIKIGMIGLDTSHSTAFTKLFNDPTKDGDLAKMQVVAAYPGGSPDIASSRDRVGMFTGQMEEMGIRIVDSIEELLPLVDVVLLESVDGRKHLEQVLPVFKAKKPVFIDKPLAANLAEGLAIEMLAKEYDGRWFSSSSLRFSPSIAKFRTDPKWQGKVRGVTAWSPCALEPTHSDLYWYGIHGVEALFTAMGPGCISVTRTHTRDADVVVGVWEDGRVGTFRGTRTGKSGYGLVVFGDKSIDTSGKYEGYAPLVEQIASFFLGSDPAVTSSETLEILTFMQAADSSKELGKSIELKSVRAKAMEEAETKVAELLAK